jgi:hypothetical protein
LDDEKLSTWFLKPASRQQQSSGGPPPPPYHLLDCEFLTVEVEFDPAVIREVLPATLRPTKEGYGGFSIVSVASGWAIAPYTGCFAWIYVEDHDSSDGAKGRFHAGGYLSGSCGEALRSYLRNTRVHQGAGSIERKEGLIVGRAI